LRVHDDYSEHGHHACDHAQVASTRRASGGGGGYYPCLADEDLISLVGQGDAFAFGVLYERHSRAVYSVARRLSGGEEREAVSKAIGEFREAGLIETPRPRTLVVLDEPNLRELATGRTTTAPEDSS
jgi:hypothetical protein